MARFYGSLQGSRGETTRMGTANSGIESHTRGWSVGVRVSGRTTTDDRDSFDIYATSGSNGYGRSVRLGTVDMGTDGRRFFSPSAFVIDCILTADDVSSIDLEDTGTVGAR